MNQKKITDERNKLCASIREIRKKRSLTMLQVSEMIGVAEATISKIETGKWVSIPIILKLGEVLNFKIKIEDGI